MSEIGRVEHNELKSDIGRLSDDWKKIDSIALYGAGIVGKICKSLFDKIDIDIAFVIDQDETKQKEKWNDTAPIISFDDALKRLDGRKIVVMAGHAAYGDIAQFLSKRGMKEFTDFCNVGQFMSEWLWDNQRMNCIFHVDMTITTKCTLNCEKCNLFIPYHREHLSFGFDEMKNNIDLFFKRIDFVTYFGLIGGETFLNPDLVKCIEYLGDNYSSQIGRITVVTNGTILPDDSLLLTMKKYNIYLSISDYTNVVHYESKINSLIEKVQYYGIDYSRNSSIVWTDFGFPTAPVQRNPEQLRKHLESCRPNWNALHGGKFYYCNVSWCAEQSGHFNLLQEDFVELTDINPEVKEECRNIVKLSRGTSSFCKICGGCGSDNTNYVTTGIQMVRS